MDMIVNGSDVELIFTNKITEGAISPEYYRKDTDERVWRLKHFYISYAPQLLWFNLLELWRWAL